MPRSLEEKRAYAREYARQWRAKNPEVVKARYLNGGKEQQRRWRAANRDRVNSNCYAWAKNNPEKRKQIVARMREKGGDACKDREKASSRKWRANNPDYGKAYSASYREKNPEKIVRNNARLTVARFFGLSSTRELTAEMEHLADAYALRILVRRAVCKSVVGSRTKAAA